MVDILFTVIFVLGVYYLMRYRLNLKKAVELSNDALYPTIEDELSSILIPTEWKEMEPLTKETKSYKYVKWGTMVATIFLTVLLWTVLATNLLGSSFFSVAYLFFVVISAVRHRGNLFILPKGLILNGRYYSSKQIKYYEVEKIIRWHELYGLDPKVNNGYKLTFKIKKWQFISNFLVIKDYDHLKKMMDLLDNQGISGVIQKWRSHPHL